MSRSYETVSRRSPVVFEAATAEGLARDGWQIVLRYEGEGVGPWIVDLSHRRRWDLQDRDVGDLRPGGLAVPPRPGDVLVEGGVIVNRMNRTQAALWHLGGEPSPALPPAGPCTETTDGHCMLAILGRDVPEVVEHLTSLDLFDPGRPRPHLTQGPMLRVPCQIVTLSAECVLLTLSRGYGQTFVDAALRHAVPHGLRPGGEDLFTGWYEGWQRAR